MNHRQRYRLGMSAYNAGLYKRAIEYLTPLASGRRSASSLLSRFYLGQAHYRLALDLFNKRQFQQASEHFRSAAQANPTGGGFARFLAVCYVGTGRLDLAAQEFETVLQNNPSDIGARIRLALTQWKQGSLVEAVAILREGVRLEPDNAELNYQLGVMLAADDELAEAERLFEKAIAIDPTQAKAFEKLAQCCSLSERHERALSYLQRAHKLDFSNSRIALQLSLLAQDLVERGHQPKVELQPPTTEPQFDESALDSLGQVIAQEPDFVPAFLSLPSSEVDTEVFSVLAAILERALVKHPEYADLHYHCGEVYRRMGRDQEAIRHAEQAVQLNPRYVNALILVGKLYGQTDRCLDGIQRLEQAINAGGDYPDVHMLLGQLCQRGGQLDRARLAYQRALDLNGDYSPAREALVALPT